MKKNVVLTVLLACLTLITSCAVKPSKAGEIIVFPNDSIVHLVENVKLGTSYTELPDEFYCNYSISTVDDFLHVILEYRLSDGSELCVELMSGPSEVSYHDFLGLSTYDVSGITVNGHKLTTDPDKYFVLPDGVSFQNHDPEWISKSTKDDAANIKAGMTLKEVYSIFGEKYVTMRRNGVFVDSIIYTLSDGNSVEIAFEIERHTVEGGPLEMYEVVKENGVKITGAA